MNTFTHFNLPLIAEDWQSFPLYRGRNFERSPGDILYPERWSQTVIEDLRKSAGEHVFQAQYQQNPEVVGNQAVRFDEIHTTKTLPPRAQCAPVIQSWDPAFVASATSDYSVCTTWGRYEGKWYLLDLFRKRMDFTDLKEKNHSHAPTLVSRSGDHRGRWFGASVISSDTQRRDTNGLRVSELEIRVRKYV